MLKSFIVLLGLLHLTFGVYILSGSPEHVVLGDNVPVTLTCTTDGSFKFVTWSKDSIKIANIIDDCVFTSISDNTYNYTCDPDNNIYNLIIPPDAITDDMQNVVWRCLPVVGQGSNSWKLTLSFPVTTVTFTPGGDNNVVDIEEGETRTFTCYTDLIRPEAWIQWYIGGQNVTDHATSRPPLQMNDKFISHSILIYKGRDVDHSKVIFCEAVNIEGRQKIKSAETSLNILFEPRLNVDIPSSSELIGLKNGTSLNITVNLIASPLPTYIQWIFRQEDDIDNVIKSYNSSSGFTYTSYIFIQSVSSTQFGYYIVIATNSIGSFRRTFTVIQKGQSQTNPASISQDSNGLFAAGISSLVIGLLCIIFAVSFVAFCRFRLQNREQMRNKDYTEFKKYPQCNPQVTDSYDILNTTAIGTTVENENQTDGNIENYDECKPPDQTFQQLNKHPEDVKEKKGDIYDIIEA